MQFVELVVSDEQALMTRAAIDLVLSDPERYVMTDEERADYERLAVFFGTAAIEPYKFPLSGRQAARIKSVIRKAKGPAQPQSRRNKRKARQARRIGFAKQRRKDNREFKDAYNEAMAKLRAEEAEAEQAHEEIAARTANEPKFDIVDGAGQLIMSDVPASALKPQLPRPVANDGPTTPGIVLPPGLDLETDALHALVPDE